jgi:hypothetical protein
MCHFYFTYCVKSCAQFGVDHINASEHRDNGRGGFPYEVGTRLECRPRNPSHPRDGNTSIPRREMKEEFRFPGGVRERAP